MAQQGYETWELQRTLFLLSQELLRLEQQQAPASLVEVMALFLEKTVDYASGIAPWWTGSLSRSHRGELESLPGQVIGYLYLDPGVINPITGNRPVDYGPVVHEDQPWMDWTTEWLIDEVLADTGDDVLEALAQQIAASLGMGPERMFSL